MKTIYFILLIAVVAVLFIVVGFLGNKIVDGMSNAARAAKNKQRREEEPAPQAESLSARFAAASRAQTAVPQTAVPQPQPQKARYCGECGQPLKEGAAFCTNCGHPTNG